MKKIIAILFLFIAVRSSGQLVYPAKWSFSIENKKADEATLVFKVKIDKDWHLYSQFTPEGGVLPMVFEFKENDCYSRVGKVTEPPYIKHFDDIFGIDEYYFENEATFKQKIKLQNGNCVIEGSIVCQVCSTSCTKGDTTFVFNIGDGKAQQKIDSAKTSPVVDTSQTSTAQTIQSPPSNNSTGLEPGCGDGSDDGKSNKSLIGIFIAGMIGGLLALLTPCVFPMVPMTVSFFTKRSGSRKKGIRNALIYAASIMLIYVSLGFLVTVTMGSAALNDLASNGFFNLAFFVIFVIFAISFFGAFEITLPSWLINKADAAGDRGGLIGIFFMAFTLSLVSFSCTGPIIGTLLVEAAQGQAYLGPLIGMTGFAFSLAVPFALFAMFPNLLSSLPKSGGWLNTVKVCLGFLELALALKFFSNVDLAYHWGFLKRELFIALWVIIFLMMGFYLLGKLRFSHDSEVPYIGTGRLMFALLTFTFTLYMIPGMWGAPLKLLSGFLPPEFYKEWKTGKGNECPHDLNCFHDYDEGMAYAKEQGKPVLIDFTGWTCTNCRWMEDNVWSDPGVLKMLTNDYVLISLYVDDKAKMPVEKQTVSKKSGKKLVTYGDKWSDLEMSVYISNSQPYYALIDNNERILANPRGGIIETEKYKAYLEEGLCRYKKRKN